MQPHEPLQPHELTACVETIHTSRWWAKVQQSASSGVLALLATYGASKVPKTVALPLKISKTAWLPGGHLKTVGGAQQGTISMGQCPTNSLPPSRLVKGGSNSPNFWFFAAASSLAAERRSRVG